MGTRTSFLKGWAPQPVYSITEEWAPQPDFLKGWAPQPVCSDSIKLCTPTSLLSHGKVGHPNQYPLTEKLGTRTSWENLENESVKIG